MKSEVTSHEATEGVQTVTVAVEEGSGYLVLLWRSPEVEKEERRRRGRKGDSPLAFTLISSSIP